MDMLEYVRKRLPTNRQQLEPIAKKVGYSASGLENIARGYVNPRYDVVVRLYKLLKRQEKRKRPAA